MKRKLFLLLCALLTMIGVQAQKDVTSQYITNATLAQGMNTGWTVTYTGKGNYDHFNDVVRGNNTVGYATEAYAGWNELAYTAYSMTQTITLPAGHYTLVNYSFFRQGQNYNTDVNKSLAKLKAGDNEIAIKTLGSISAAGYANSQAEGANCFDSKMYRNALDFTIDVDNTPIEVGVYGTFDAAYSWCIVGQFELINNDIPATMDAPFDVTGYITNPGFEYRNMTGWTQTPSGYLGTQGNNQSFKVGGYYAEKWQGSGALPEGSATQTIQNLPAGYYKLTANLGGNGTYVDLNGKRASWTSDKDYTVGYVLSENEDLTITFGKTAEGTANWIHFDNFRLQFCGDVQAALTTLLNTAKDLIDNAKMSNSARSALQTAYDTYNHSYSDVDELLDAIAAMQSDLEDAQKSIDTYTEINAAISTYATKAASLDAAGQAAYDASNVTTKYNNGTYETLAEAKTDLWSAFALATKAQTTEGSDWTGILINPGFEENTTAFAAPIGWTLAGTANGIQTQNNDGFDGYRVGTMFGERWDGSAIKDFDAYQTIDGMPSGVYEVKAVATFNGTGGYLYANDIKTNITDAKYYTVQVALDANSTLRVGVKNETSDDGSWFKCDDFTITLVSAGLPDVTPVVGKMNAAVAAAQTAAVEAYADNRTVANYNTASAAVAAAQASVDAYAAADAAIVKAEGIIAETNVFVAANKTAYQDAINTAKSAYNAGSMEDATATSLENNLNGGTVYKHEGDPMRPFYSGAWSATNEVSIYTNNWSVEGNTDGSNFTTPFIEDWVADANSLANTTISASVTNLPSGTYNVTARVRMRLKNSGEAPVNGLSLQASNGDPVAVSGTPNYGSFYVAEVAATGYVTEEGGSLGINFIVNNTNASWLSIKAVNYERTGDLPAADAADYAALKDALDAVAGNVVGFEAGEYAPYNNKEAVVALNVAKAIDPTVTNVKATVQAATTALTGATWTANAEELNAVYDGNFAIQPEHTTGPTALAGWNNPAGIRQLIKNTETYPGLNTASAKAAVFAWGGTTMKYGETDGYTIPLKGHAIYELSFKTCGWIDGDMGYVNVDVKNASDEGLQTVRTATATKRINGENPWDEFKILFVTGEAGNYKLGMWTSKHTTFTDIVLKKAASQTLTITDGEALPKFAPGTYPAASYTRTIPAESKYGTICLPFNVKSDENITFYNLESVEGTTLNLTSADEGVAAGVPAVFKKLTADATEISVTTANAKVVAAPVAQDGDTKLVGTFSDINVSENVEKCYYIKSNAFWQGYDNFNVKAYRAYIQTNVNEARLIIKTDGEDPTAINAIEAAEAEEGVLKDGKYLIDGKVIIVKNGVKYGANGQKLN